MNKILYGIVSFIVVALCVSSEKEFKLAMLCYFIGVIGGFILRDKNEIN